MNNTLTLSNDQNDGGDGGARRSDARHRPHPAGSVGRPLAGEPPVGAEGDQQPADDQADVRRPGRLLLHPVERIGQHQEKGRYGGDPDRPTDQEGHAGRPGFGCGASGCWDDRQWRQRDDERQWHHFSDLRAEPIHRLPSLTRQLSAARHLACQRVGKDGQHRLIYAAGVAAALLLALIVYAVVRTSQESVERQPTVEGPIRTVPNHDGHHHDPTTTTPPPRPPTSPGPPTPPPTRPPEPPGPPPPWTARRRPLRSSSRRPPTSVTPPFSIPRTRHRPQWMRRPHDSRRTDGRGLSTGERIRRQRLGRPIRAVIVKDGNIVARGQNQVLHRRHHRTRRSKPFVSAVPYWFLTARRSRWIDRTSPFSNWSRGPKARQTSRRCAPKC